MLRGRHAGLGVQAYSVGGYGHTGLGFSTQSRRGEEEEHAEISSA